MVKNIEMIPVDDIPQAKPSRVGRDVWADQIFDYIPSHETDTETWISVSDLAESTGLTEAQVMTGAAYIRDTFPEFPLISGREGYRFSVDEDQIIAFRTMRARTAYTHMRRTWSGAVKPYVAHLPQPLGRMLEKQFERLLEDIGELIEV